MFSKSLPIEKKHIQISFMYVYDYAYVCSISRIFFNDENQFIELVAGTKVCFLCFGPDGG